jgi:hypothetical protein
MHVTKTGARIHAALLQSRGEPRMLLSRMWITLQLSPNCPHCSSGQVLSTCQAACMHLRPTHISSLPGKAGSARQLGWAPSHVSMAWAPSPGPVCVELPTACRTKQ